MVKSNNIYSIPQLASMFAVNWSINTRKGEVTAYIDLLSPRKKRFTNKMVDQELNNRLEVAKAEYQRRVDFDLGKTQTFPFNDAGKELFDLAAKVDADGETRWYRQGTMLPRRMTKKKAVAIMGRRNELRSQWDTRDTPTPFEKLSVIPLPTSQEPAVFLPEKLWSLDARLNKENPRDIFTEVWVVEWDCRTTGRSFYPSESRHSLSISAHYDGSRHVNTLQFPEPPTILNDEYFKYDYGSGYSEYYFLTHEAAVSAIKKNFTGLVVHEGRPS